MSAIDVIFPFIENRITCDLGDARTEKRKLIANPKAVMAQTFASSNAEVALQSSMAWKYPPAIFSIQYGGTKLDLFELNTVYEKWIAYPFTTVQPGTASGCLVWLQEEKTRRRVRHLRVYGDLNEAYADNNVIAEALGAICRRTL